MDLQLADRVYVVTGGSRGLGRAVAERLVAEGAHVVLNGRDEERTTAAARQIGTSEQVLGVAGDLTDPGTETRLVAAGVARWGRLDGALLSTGGPPPGNASLAKDAEWRAAFEQTFIGPLRTARAVASLVGADGGSIAFVLSTSVRSPIEGLALSNGIRPGLAMAAKSLADELGTRNVRVNSLLPGRIDTDRTRELDAVTGDPVGARRDAEARVPLRRYGTPEEFAAVAAFVLSPLAAYVNGTVLPVDGGALRTL